MVRFVKARSIKNRADNKDQTGIYLIAVVGIILSLLAILGFVIDLSNLFVAKSDLQRAVDSAALGGATLLGGGVTSEQEVRTAAAQLAVDNLKLSGISAAPSDFNVNIVGGTRVDVAGRVARPTLLLKLVPGFAATNTVSADAKAQFAGSSGGAGAIINLVLDISGSMSEVVPNSGGKTKLDFVRAAAIEFIKYFNESGDIIGILQLNATTQNIYPVGPGLQMPTTRGYSKAQATLAINSIIPSTTLTLQGYTNISGGLYDAWTFMQPAVAANPNMSKYVVVFSDFVPSIMEADWRFTNLAPQENSVAIKNIQDIQDSAHIGQRHWYTTQWRDPPDFASSSKTLVRAHGDVLSNIFPCARDINPSPTNFADWDCINQDSPGMNSPIGPKFRFFDPDGRPYKADYVHLTNGYAPVYKFRQVRFNATIAAADWLRHRTATVALVAGLPQYSGGLPILGIGFGEDPQTCASFDPYQCAVHNSGPVDARRDFLGTRITNDPKFKTSHPDFPDMDTRLRLDQDNSTPGTYLSTPDPKDLVTVFNEIAQIIRRPVLVE